MGEFLYMRMVDGAVFETLDDAGDGEVVGRLAALHRRLGHLIDSVDACENEEALWDVFALEPVPEDMAADVLGTILHQGNIFDDDGGETAIGWMVADVEERVTAVEQRLGKVAKA